MWLCLFLLILLFSSQFLSLSIASSLVLHFHLAPPVLLFNYIFVLLIFSTPTPSISFSSCHPNWSFCLSSLIFPSLHLTNSFFISFIIPLSPLLILSFLSHLNLSQSFSFSFIFIFLLSSCLPLSLPLCLPVYASFLFLSPSLSSSYFFSLPLYFSLFLFLPFPSYHFLFISLFFPFSFSSPLPS